MQPPISPQGAPKRTSSNLAVFCHVLAFAGYLIPVGHIIGPLVLWLVKRQDDPTVDHHGKESVNFQISVTIYSIALLIGMFVFGIFFPPAFFVLLLVIVALAIFDLVVVIMASIAASRGELYRYPLSIRLIR